MSAGHDHALPATTKERSLRWALGLTSAFLIAEVVGGVVLNSLALLSDAAHMFTDVAALAIALAAIRIARRPADQRRTFGYHRFEILAAAFNALLLFGVAGHILFEAWQRWRQPEEVQTTGVLVVAALGLVVNLASMWMLRSGKDASLNVKGAYLEVWSDMLIDRRHRRRDRDSRHRVELGRLGDRGGHRTVGAAAHLGALEGHLNILLEGVPEGIDIAAVRQSLLGLPGVLGVHDLHVWAVTSGPAQSHGSPGACPRRRDAHGTSR
jgi:cobalt-zinc-cadmium efflux system protein